MVSALLIHGVPVECINQAAVTYWVPAKVIISVLLTEGGRVGEAHPNSNGTYDLGPMQINSSWLPTLSNYGITSDQIQNDPCMNTMVGTWILSDKIASVATSENNYWQGVAGYHSLTPKLNISYQHQVKSNFDRINQALR